MTRAGPRARTAGSPPSGARLVTLWFPDWPVIASGVRSGEPAAVFRANRVVAVSPAAAEEGVRAGLRRREAQARCPELRVLDHDPDRDARQFEAVVRAVGDLVPLLEVTEPGLLTFPTRGPSRYVGGDHQLAERVIGLAGSALEGDHVPVVGIADGRFASGVAARRAAADGRSIIVPTGVTATAAFLAPFPVRAVHEVGGLGLELVDLLGRLGLRTLGQLAEVAAAELLARFGPPGAAAHDFASAGDARPVTVAPPPPELTVTRVFEDPMVVLEPIVFLAKQAAAELCGLLGDRGLVVTRLVVEAETEHGERSERAWYRPVGLSAAAMVERVRWQLDGWVRQPGGLSGGVAFVRLAAVEVRADSGRQLGFWGGQTQADDWAMRATTRLAGLLGPDAVTVPEWRGGRDPADRYALVPAATTDLADPAARAGSVAPPVRPPWPGGLPAPSPTQVYDPPVACDVLDARGLPVRVSGRGAISADPAVVTLSGRRYPVTAWAGPWPIEERWWDPATARRRARFQVVTETEALLVSLQAGAWWLDARYG